MSAPAVAIVGAYGAVGRAATHQLAAWGIGPLRIGGRDELAARKLASDCLGLAGVARDEVGSEAVTSPCAASDEIGRGAEAMRVDLEDEASLRAFCDGAAVVLCCAGPSIRVLDRVGQAAAAGRAAYVDASGDDALRARFAAGGLADPRRPVVLSAGMMPGLTGVLPRALARLRFDAVARLTAFVGGCDRLTETAAVDYLATLVGGFGEPFAAWRDDRRVSQCLAPREAIRLPFVSGDVTGHPYLSTEAESLASTLGLTHVDWYNLIAGERTTSILRRSAARSGVDAASRDARELARATELDSLGRTPYQVLLFQIDGTRDGAPATHTLMLRGRDASTLTGTMAAAVAASVLAGEVSPGLYHAADIVDPVTIYERVCSAAAPPVRVEIFDSLRLDSPTATQEMVL